ncbi:MAG: sodium:proline symporter [Bacteroidetes bacterium 4572_128]|nr:MAG: sodium:proline symporter [Bacteroidetes bacterium 4572_128]
MVFSSLDYLIIGLYFIVNISIVIYVSTKSENRNNFFLGGRKLPWYIAGTSMVATTFAADTPLAVTELVAENGIAGNWLWWNMLFGGTMTVFFFARLWRRAGILTDAEFVAIRYSGKSAKFLRAFRSIYIGIFMNVIVMAWVNLAMLKIIKVMFPNLNFFGINEFNFLGINLDAHFLTLIALLFFVAIYSSLSGLKGIAITDSFQFIMAMTGSIVLAIFTLNHYEIGGIEGLKEKLPDWVFNFIPSIDTENGESSNAGLFKMSITAFVAYLGVQWWASWYPGAEPGGGGYIAQRMMSAKNEKHSIIATLWFQIAHFAIRPWPWIIVALSALVLYPNESDKGATYVMIIRDLLPSGLLGLLMAAFFAAYMSTIASQTVWGTSYIINDLLEPILKKKREEKFYIKISRLTTFLLMILSLIVTTQFTKISDAWKFILVCSGGIGIVLILRWFWWRINAWSEISAMIAPYFIYPFFKFNLTFESSLIIIVFWSIFVSMLVTFLTKPTDEKKLMSFYKKMHIGGILWKKISDKMPEVKSDKNYRYLFINWFFSCLMIMFILFGTGKIIFGEISTGSIFLALAFISGNVVFFVMKKI